MRLLYVTYDVPYYDTEMALSCTIIIRDGRLDRDPMGLQSRDASPGLGIGTGTDFFGTLGTGTDYSGTSRDFGFAWDLCPNESQSA